MVDIESASIVMIRRSPREKRLLEELAYLRNSETGEVSMGITV